MTSPHLTIPVELPTGGIGSTQPAKIVVAVIVEMISVIIRAESVVAHYPGGRDAFQQACPNRTLCTDGELFRVGFMSPHDTGRYIEGLEQHGLVYLKDGRAVDLVVVGQFEGLAVPCDWAEFKRFRVEEQFNDQPIDDLPACRLIGSTLRNIAAPTGGRYSEFTIVEDQF